MKKAKDCNTLMECYLGAIYWQKKVLKNPKSKQWQKRFNSYIYRYNDNIMLSPKSHKLKIINTVPKSKAEKEVQRYFYAWGFLWFELSSFEAVFKKVLSMIPEELRHYNESEYLQNMPLKRKVLHFIKDEAAKKELIRLLQLVADNEYLRRDIDIEDVGDKRERYYTDDNFSSIRFWYAMKLLQSEVENAMPVNTNKSKKQNTLFNL